MEIKKFLFILLMLFISIASVHAYTNIGTDSYTTPGSYTSTTSSNIVLTATALEKGIITRVYMRDTTTANPGVTIKNSDGVTIAGKTTSSDVATFTLSDYSEVIGKGETFTITLSGGTKFYKNGQSFSGNYFTFTNQQWTDYTSPLTNSIIYKAYYTEIIADIEESYNYNNISINLTTNDDDNTDMSYVLDSGSEIAICSNCNSATLNLTDLSDGLHEIIFISTSGTNQFNTTKNFTIDKTPPGINFNLTEWNYQDLNLSSYLSCSDVSIDFCNILIDSQNKASTETITFTHNGALSYTITAGDLAGNTANQSGTLNVDPYQYFYFEDLASNPISNFILDGVSYENYAAIKLSEYGYGSFDLLFQKYGYAQKNVSVTFNSTSFYNLTTQSGITQLYVYIRDRDSESLITDTISMDLIGEDYAGTYSTTSGYIETDDIAVLPGIYRLTFTGTGFAMNDYYFTHTGYDIVNITTYMINESETIPIKVILRDIFSNPKSACLVKAKQYFISENDYLAVDMKSTNSLGEAIFDLEYAKWYQFVVECDGVTQTEPGQQITSTPLYLTWNEDEALTLFEGLPNLAYEPISWTNTSNSTGYFRFEYNDLNNIVSQGCLYVYEKAFSGNILLGSSCVSSASATININANYTAESGKTYIARGFVTYEGETTFVDEGSQTFMKGEGTWDYGLGNWGSMLLIGVLFLIGSAMHPFAAIAFAWIGAAVSVKFEMLPIDWAALIGLGALVIGLIIFRGKKQ